MWANYAQLGYHRLIYTNTLSVLSDAAGMFHRAMGDDQQATADIAREVSAATGWAQR